MMETASGFKPLTSSITISLASSQPSNLNTIIVNGPDATSKQQKQPQPLHRALFEQAPFRRPTNLSVLPAPVANNTQSSPNESLLNAPTPTSSIESGQNSMSMPTFYPHFSGVDNLILAAKIQATSRVDAPLASGANESPNFNSIYSSPSMPTTSSSYSDYVTAYYQQQLMQQHHVQHQQQTRNNNLALTPVTGQQVQSSAFYDNQPRQPAPRSRHELELYDLLKQANLLEYFGRFIKFGGDDVQQLAEADEQEFVEIMELVGMNHKPLHMRRMQKALNKWLLDREESLEVNENFKKPDAPNDGLGFYVNKIAQDYLSQHNTSLCSTLSPNESLAPTFTSVTRTLFPNESNNIQNNNNNNNNNNTTNIKNNNILDSPQQQYNTPLEVIKNAPKKPRLMDNTKPSDLTKGILAIDDNGPLGGTSSKVKQQDKHFSGSGASAQATGHSPQYCPYSPTYSDISVDDGPTIEVSDQFKNSVDKLIGTSKRKRSLKRPFITGDLTRY